LTPRSLMNGRRQRAVVGDGGIGAVVIFKREKIKNSGWGKEREKGGEEGPMKTWGKGTTSSTYCLGGGDVAFGRKGGDSK